MNKQEYDTFRRFKSELFNRVIDMLDAKREIYNNKHIATDVSSKFLCDLIMIKGQVFYTVLYSRMDPTLNKIFDYRIRLPEDLMWSDDYLERGSKIIDEMETEQKLAYLLKNAKI